MPNFLSCFQSPSASSTSKQDDIHLIDSDPSRPIKEGCIFCNVSTAKGFGLVYEDDELIAFNDRAPGASTHLLIIPRYHQSSINGSRPHPFRSANEYLDPNKIRLTELTLVRSMARLGTTLTSSPPGLKMGFHIPPFSSVHHLHLHVLVPPYNIRGRFKYPARSSKDGAKKWSWFVTVDQVVRILERGQTIGLGSSSITNSTRPDARLV